MKLQAAPSASSETYLWPQPHTHAGPGVFYVLEFIVGEETRKGGRGFWALAPSGASHTFGIGASTNRLLDSLAATGLF